MKSLHHLEAFRMKTPEVLEWFGSFGDAFNGAFILRSPVTNEELKIIASSGEGWDHVSVSKIKRIPSWIEMSYVKQRFFLDEEAVMQLHVPTSMHINYHPNCLHLWRPQDQIIPLPPAILVGPPNQEEKS